MSSPNPLSEKSKKNLAPVISIKTEKPTGTDAERPLSLEQFHHAKELKNRFRDLAKTIKPINHTERREKRS